MRCQWPKPRFDLGGDLALRRKGLAELGGRFGYEVANDPRVLRFVRFPAWCLGLLQLMDRLVQNTGGP